MTLTPNGSHRSWLVAGVGLGGVLEVGVRPTGTVDTNVPRHADVGTTVRLAHHSHNGDLKQRDVSRLEMGDRSFKKKAKGQLVAPRQSTK